METPQQDIEGSQRIIDQESECTGVAHDDVGRREGEAVVAGEERARSTEKESEVGSENTIRSDSCMTFHIACTICLEKPSTFSADHMLYSHKVVMWPHT